MKHDDVERPERPEDPALEHLLSAARRADLPDSARLARVRGRLLPTHAAAPQPSASASAATTGAWLGVKVGVGLAVALLGTWVAVHTLTHHSEPSDGRVRELAPRAVFDAAAAGVSAASAGDHTTLSEAPPSAAPPERAGEVESAQAAAEPDAPTRSTHAPPSAAAPFKPAQAQRSRAKPRPRPPHAETAPASEPAPADAPSLSAQASLLRAAALAARAGRLEDARAALASFARAYPNSQLKPEYDRLAQHVDTLTRAKSAGALPEQ